MEKVEMNKDMKLSEHFSLGELTKTRVAIENLTNICENWLEALRQAQGPLIINSGYRSPEVNKLAGGAPTSNHLTGCAVDIHVSGFEQAIRYASILLDISEGTQRDYDELFIEKNKTGSHWIHFAVKPKDNRRKLGFIKV